MSFIKIFNWTKFNVLIIIRTQIFQRIILMIINISIVMVLSVILNLLNVCTIIISVSLLIIIVRSSKLIV